MDVNNDVEQNADRTRGEGDHGGGSKSFDLVNEPAAGSGAPNIGDQSYGSGERYGGRDSGLGLVPNNTEQEKMVNDREEKPLAAER